MSTCSAGSCGLLCLTKQKWGWTCFGAKSAQSLGASQVWSRHTQRDSVEKTTVCKHNVRSTGAIFHSFLWAEMSTLLQDSTVGQPDSVCYTCERPMDLFNPHGISNRRIFSFGLLLSSLKFPSFSTPPPALLPPLAPGSVHTHAHRLIN